MADTEKKVVVGNGKKRRFTLKHLNRTKVFIVLMAAIIIAAAAVTAVLLTRDRSADDSNGLMTMQSAEERDFSYTEQVNGLIAAKRYDDALALLAIQVPNDSQEVLGLKAVVYYSKGDHQAALDTYAAIKQKSALRASQAAYAGLAAEALGQNQTALDFYEEAISIEKNDTDPQNFLRESTIREYQAYADGVKKKL